MFNEGIADFFKQNTDRFTSLNEMKTRPNI